MSIKPKVAISQDFMLAFAQLPKSQQKKVMEFVSKFRQDPQSGGINYEKINDARVKAYRSVRIDQQYRGIVLKPEQGNVYVLFWVAKHDDAYDWARRHDCQIHPETGTLQIFETQFADAPPEESTAAEPVAPPQAVEPVVPQPQASQPLFDLDRDQLLSIGVPEVMLESVRALRSESALEAMEKRLPLESFEALYLLAAGTPWEEISRDYGASDQPVDTHDVAAALERPSSRRRFHVVEDELELREMLEAPLERWRVFLHPSQRKLVERHWNGPVRVLGGAGTGKTVVAMHRARWLVRNILKPDEKLLLTTFTANLATDIQANLRKICSAGELERIQVRHIDAWVSEFLRRHHYPHTIVYPESNKEYRDIWRLALQLDELGQPESFYREEWQRVILPQRIYTQAAYFRAGRTGRGVALNRKQRAQVWRVFEELRSRLHKAGLRTFEDATLDAVDILREGKGHLPYRAVVVDEAQDMGPEALTLIRQLLAEQADDLFIVGDGHQRIYRRKAVMGQCGIRIVGRSHKLRINYRTTEETRRFATQVLEGIAVDDLDGGEDAGHDYRSLIHGAAPEIQGYPTLEAECAALVERVGKLIEEGVSSQDICVAARTRRLRDQFAQALQRQGIEAVTLDKQVDDRALPGVRLATLHRVKGLEFRYVFLPGINEGVMPLKQAVSNTDDPVEQRHNDLNERALLHVAATRAIRQLFVSYAGVPSPYLQGLSKH